MQVCWVDLEISAAAVLDYSSVSFGIVGKGELEQKWHILVKLL